MKDSGFDTTRRRFGALLAAGVSVGSAGCLGTDALPCEDHAVVLSRSLTSTLVRIPFDQGSEAHAVARDLRNADFTVETYAELETPGEVDTRIVEVRGGIDRRALRAVLARNDCRPRSVEERTVGDGPFTRISGELAFPWAEPLLEERVSALEDAARRVGLDVPSLAAAKTAVGVGAPDESVDPSAVRAVRTLLRPSGNVSVTFKKPGRDDERATAFRFFSGVGDDDILTEDVSVREASDGYLVEATPEDNLYIRSLFGPTLTTVLPDDASDAALEIRLDGELVQRRPLSRLERRYLEWYRDNPTENPTGFDPVPLTVTDLSAAAAVRIASSLAVPTGSPNVFSERCG